MPVPRNKLTTLSPEGSTSESTSSLVRLAGRSFAGIYADSPEASCRSCSNKSCAKNWSSVLVLRGGNVPASRRGYRNGSSTRESFDSHRAHS